jgi:hypothetical protein
MVFVSAGAYGDLHGDLVTVGIGPVNIWITGLGSLLEVKAASSGYANTQEYVYLHTMSLLVRIRTKKRLIETIIKTFRRRRLVTALRFFVISYNIPTIV